MLKATGIITAILIACSPAIAHAQPETSQVKTATQNIEALEGKWVLSAHAKQENPSTNQITATFSDGKLEGNSGCNDYSATYEQQGKKLSLSNNTNTLNSCSDWDTVEQELVYLQLLTQTNSYRLKGEQLEIYNQAGERILTFEAAPDLASSSL